MSLFISTPAFPDYANAVGLRNGVLWVSIVSACHGFPLLRRFRLGCWSDLLDLNEIGHNDRKHQRTLTSSTEQVSWKLC